MMFFIKILLFKNMYRLRKIKMNVILHPKMQKKKLKIFLQGSGIKILGRFGLVPRQKLQVILGVMKIKSSLNQGFICYSTKKSMSKD